MGAAIAFSAYRKSELGTLSPRDLLVKLFEGLERFIEQGSLAMRNHHCELAAKNCQRIRAILFELQATLNFEAGGEIAKRLDGIYAFMILEVTKASLQQDADRLHALLRVIRPLREGWQGVPRQFAHTTSLTGDTHANVISMRT